jgi:signal transduction histidine kinase
MLQRIQSVFMALATACMIVTLFIPIGKMHHFQQLNVMDHTPLLVITLMSIFFPIYNLFQFKRRKQQIRICLYSILLYLAVMVLAHYYVHEDPLTFSPAIILQKLSLGSLMPIAAIVFQILAIRNIMKDDQLVRSMDRFR